MKLTLVRGPKNEKEKKRAGKARFKLTWLALVLAVFVVSLVFGASRIVAANTPNITNVEISPLLDISRFSPYNILATITDFNTSSTATASITGVNGDGGDYWDYYADGSTASGDVTKNLTYDSEISKWVSSNVYPDSIYPEIYFAPSAITWDNTPPKHSNKAQQLSASTLF